MKVYGFLVAEKYDDETTVWEKQIAHDCLFIHSNTKTQRHLTGVAVGDVLVVYSGNILGGIAIVTDKASPLEVCESEIITNREVQFDYKIPIKIISRFTAGIIVNSMYDKYNELSDKQIDELCEKCHELESALSKFALERYGGIFLYKEELSPEGILGTFQYRCDFIKDMLNEQTELGKRYVHIYKTYPDVWSATQIEVFDELRILLNSETGHE